MKRVPITEHEHQKAVIKWANDMMEFQPQKFGVLKWLYAIPNGARTAMSTAKKCKAEGMKAGVPDLCLPYPLKLEKGEGWPLHITCAGLYIEMKSKDTRGKVSPEQHAWLDYLSRVGYRVATAWSAKEAIKIIEDYLSGN